MKTPEKDNGWKKVNRKKPNTKFKWKPSKDKEMTLTAGGLLPFDDRGIWVIGEYNKTNPKILEYTDFGGRYNFEDGDIFATIAREFNEETYHSSEITRKQVLKLSKLFENVYIDGYHHKPVYICMIVPTTALRLLDISLDKDKFAERRAIVLNQNPDVPRKYYRPQELLYITYKDIQDDKYRLSNRLKCILEKSCVLGKLCSK